MITIPPQVAYYAMRGGILVAVAASLWLHGCHTGTSHQEAKTAAVRAAYHGFRADTERLGVAAQERTASRELAYKLNKERADEESARSLAALRADRDRLRRARPSGDFVPRTAAIAGSPDRACFDRPELERAIREFDTEVAGLIGQGDETRLKLDSAIRWATTR